MKKLLLVTLLLSLQAQICATEGSCCSSCPTPKIEAKKEEVKPVVLPAKEEAPMENVVEVEVLAEETLLPEAELE